MPFPLDLPTLVAFAAFLHLALAGVMVYTQVFRKVYPGFSSWMGSHLAWAAGAALLCLRQGVDDATFVLVGNACFLVFVALNVAGYQQYVGLQHRGWRRRCVWGVVVAAMVLLAYFYFIDKNFEARVVVFSASTGGLILWGLLEPRFRAVRRYAAEGIFIAVVGISCLLQWWRVLLVLTHSELLLYSSGNPADIPFKLSMTLDAFIALGMVFSQISMTSERVEEELEDALRVARDQAHTDHLTGCHNRRYFLELVQGALARAQRTGEPVCLAMLDVDHFKAINDGEGHLAGDAVLRNLYQVLRPTLRQTDVFGRLGGEEFALCLERTSLAEAAVVMERLRALLRGASLLEHKPEMRISVSIGVACWMPGQSLEQLLARADEAMYIAKAAGRDRVQVATDRAAP